MLYSYSFKQNHYFKRLCLSGLVFILFIAHSGPGISESDERIKVADFSGESEGNSTPGGWEIMSFKGIEKHSEYFLIKENGTTVLKAVSHSSASGIVKKIKIDPSEYPIIRWRWKVQNVYRRGNVRTKQGDDYPARIYITFNYNPKDLSIFEKLKYETAKAIYGEYPPGGAVTYIWGSNASKGLSISNPYTDRVLMIVVESGKDHLNKWITEERNIYDDYLKAFGKAPPPISGVAIMTDSDNTGESAVAFYGDLFFMKKGEP